MMNSIHSGMRHCLLSPDPERLIAHGQKVHQVYTHM